jgi:hypothetical protein
MVSPVPSREPDPQEPEPLDDADAFEELSNLFKDPQAVERVDDLPPQPSVPPPEPVYEEPADDLPPVYQEPPPELPPEPAASSVAEVTEAIFAESAALAMNEIAERLDAIEQAVADRLDAVDRASSERLAEFDRVAKQRFATLDRAAQGIQIPDDLRDGLAKLGQMGELAGRVDGAEARIRANAERTIEALRNVNARFEGRIEELGARIESLEGALERLRQGVEAVATYVRRIRQDGEPYGPTAEASPQARKVMERVWREPE